MRVEIKNLLENFDSKKVIDVKKMIFIGVDGFDVYNLTAPFKDEDKIILAGRVEKRDSEHSKVCFFEELEPNKWHLLKDYPEFELQDPYISFIDGELILGGTEIFPHPDNPENLWWHAKKFRGLNVKSLTSFFEGPKGMKDIRLTQLPNGKVIVLSRPQGEKGGRGKIGVVICDSLSEVTVQKINDAKLLDQFSGEEWGGGNELHILSNGLVGILGHIANFDSEDNRHYYPMVFTYNPETGETTDIEIICKRDLLEEGDTKRTDLVDVLFSGGLIRHEDGTATLYTGVSDCESHYAVLEDPFLKYEVIV